MATLDHRGDRAQSRSAAGALLLWLTLLALPWGWHASVAAQGVPGGTVLITETFQDAAVVTPGFTARGATCLTGAAGPPPAGAAPLPDCTAFRSGPVPPLGVVPGYLQLTDGRSRSAGALLYNRPIPASAGLLVTFDLWQYGGTGADGIAFFLVDGTTALTQLGGEGGSLGYAQSPGAPGIPGGALGFGFDAFGNFYSDNFNHGFGCPPERTPPFPTARAPDTITLRGPGDGALGYCYLESTTVPGTNPPQSSLPGSLRGASLATAARHVQITIQPATGSVAPHVLVAVDFHDGQGLQPVLDVLAPPGLPLTYKFGWVGSSGRVNDVHLLGNLRVSTIEPLHQLSLVTQVDHMTPLPDPLVVDSVLPYQFVVTNGGHETLTALEVQATTGSPVSCPRTILPPAPAAGATVVCTGTHTLTQADIDAGVLVTTATATSRDPGNQPVTSEPSAVTLGVGATPQPRLALQAFVLESPPYTLGQTVTFQYQLTNTSPVPLTHLQVTADRVAGLGCVPGAPTTVCTGTHLLQASDLDTRGVFTHTAVGVGDAPDGTPVAAPPVTLSLPVGTDIAVTMQVDPPLAAGEDVVTYVVTATNQGALEATGVQLTDALPADTTFVAATPAPGTTYDPVTGIWAIGPLARGATGTLLLQVRVTTPTLQPNRARLTALDQLDSDPTNNEAEDQPTLADLVVTTTVSQLAPPVGETVTFTVLVQNRGPHPATGVQLVGSVEAGLTLLTATPSQGTVSAATGEWDIGALAVGATTTLLVTARVEEAGPLRTLASVSAEEQHDPDPSTNIAGLDLSGQRAADVQVHTTVDHREPPVGSGVTVTVTITNAGPTAATGVQLTVPLPPGLALVTATPSQGTYSAATGVWEVGTLALGAQSTLVVQARVTQPGPLLILATTTAQEEADPVPSNDASGVVLNGQAADLQVRTTVDRPMPAVGDRVTVTVTVTNAGPSTATGVAVTVDLPAGVSLQIATPSQGTYTVATGVWLVGALASSGGRARATLRLEGVVTRAGTLLTRATATAEDQVDPNPLNDQGTITLQTPGTPPRPPPATNTPPEARDDTLSTPVTGAVTLAVLANDRDRDGDRLTLVALSSARGGHRGAQPGSDADVYAAPGLRGP